MSVAIRGHRRTYSKDSVGVGRVVAGLGASIRGCTFVPRLDQGAEDE